MKNNEIMISAMFEDAGTQCEATFLVLKDITLRSLIEAIYYGLRKNEPDGDAFAILDNYLKTRKELQVLYTARGDFSVIDFTAVNGKGESPSEDGEEDGETEAEPVSMPDMKLDELGFVTSSCLLFTTDTRVRARGLFERAGSSHILKSDSSLEYNISTRRLNVIEPSVIDIIPPGEMPQKSKASILDMIIPTLLSTGGMLGARLLMTTDSASGGMGSTMIMMSLAMGVVAFVTSLYNFLKQRGEHKASVKEWKENYESYIARKITTIKEWQKSDIKYLNSVYPGMGALFDNASEINGVIFSRSQNDSDFMKISLGASGEVKPLFEIKSEKKDNISYDIRYKKRGDSIEITVPSRKEDRRRRKLSPQERALEDRNRFLLTDLAYNFANKGVDPLDPNEVIGFNYLRGEDGVKPPLLLDLKSSGALGVVSEDERTSLNFVRHVVFELAYYHSPEDLQFVFFFRPESDRAKQDAILENYRYLPHTNELFDGVSQFVFDKESSGTVFGQLLSIMNERTKPGGEEDAQEGPGRKLTQIVCVVIDDYDIKETGFSKFLPEAPKEGEPYVNSNGLTFIFVQPVKDELPKYCGNIVDIDKDNPNGRRSSLRYNVLSRETLNVLSGGGDDDPAKARDTDKLIEYKHFQNDYMFDEDVFRGKYELAFRRLSAIYYTRIAENGKVPSTVTLFDLYGYDSSKVGSGEVTENVASNWSDTASNDVTRGLAAPIGRNEHGNVSLDLYEKADGPHMLVAGTTGSGKSETIITYLIGLCMRFSPQDLNLMLVDMKGGGFSDRLGSLPHCVGAVTDTAGEEEGTSAAYMLKRFLDSLNAEIKRRKLLLSSLGVDNADAYIRASRLIRQIRELEGSPDQAQAAEKLKKRLNARQLEALGRSPDEFSPLSHLVLVVDEFTELKRFSAESDDTDFIAEITTIARVGRTLGFHIVLVSQNIEGAITDDIRVNSKARICLKVATKQASKEMIDSTAAAAPGMPLNGRAYLLVGTGTRFEYFQSGYTGANKNSDIEAPVLVTRAVNSGRFDAGFYSSRSDNAASRRKNEQVSEHDTQLAYMVSVINEISQGQPRPRQVFLPPLPGLMADATQWRGI